jgi:hypothetical protein
VTFIYNIIKRLLCLTMISVPVLICHSTKRWIILKNRSSNSNNNNNNNNNNTNKNNNRTLCLSLERRVFQ